MEISGWMNEAMRTGTGTRETRQRTKKEQYEKKAKDRPRRSTACPENFERWSSKIAKWLT
jgi:hypothetical protein